MRFGMNTTTRIPKLFLTAQTVNPLRFPLHVPNESIADEHPINIQIFCRKLRFRCQRILCIILFWRSRSGQVHSFMAALTWLHSVETNLTLTCPSPKSFAWTLPDFGRHVTSVFQGLSPSCSVGRVGENPGNQVDRNLVAKVATQQEFLIAKGKMLVTLAPVSVAIWSPGQNITKIK